MPNDFPILNQRGQVEVSLQPTNTSQRRRIEREKRTIGAMMSIYCRGHHPAATDRPCPECGELLAYAMARLDRCVFGGLKPVCAKCTIHCYKPAMRERVRAVMRYAGPRMLVRHPILSLWHQLDSHAAPPPTHQTRATHSSPPLPQDP